MTKLAIGALLMGGAAFATAAPAAARGYIGFSFGFGYPAYDNPCDYYDYYDAPPPWGLPPDYCDYDVFWEPVFWDGYWYRGPIYYRWDDDHRVYWLDGGWRRDDWHGARPGGIEWRNRGGDRWRGEYRDRYRGQTASYGNDYYSSGHYSRHYDGRNYDSRRHDGDRRGGDHHSRHYDSGQRSGNYLSLQFRGDRHDGDHQSRHYDSGHRSSGHDSGHYSNHYGGHDGGGHRH